MVIDMILHELARDVELMCLWRFIPVKPPLQV